MAETNKGLPRSLDELYARVSKLEGGSGGTTTVTSADISDATAVGKAVLVAKDAAAARTSIGAGTSSLALGTTATTAMAGNAFVQGAAVADLAADADLPTTVAKVNALLAALRTAKIIAS